MPGVEVDIEPEKDEKFSRAVRETSRMVDFGLLGTLSAIDGGPAAENRLNEVYKNR